MARHRDNCRDSSPEVFGDTKGCCSLGGFENAAHRISSMRRLSPSAALLLASLTMTVVVSSLWLTERLEPIGYVPPAEYEAQYYEQAAVA